MAPHCASSAGRELHGTALPVGCSSRFRIGHLPVSSCAISFAMQNGETRRNPKISSLFPAGCHPTVSCRLQGVGARLMVKSPEQGLKCYCQFLASLRYKFISQVEKLVCSIGRSRAWFHRHIEGFKREISTVELCEAPKYPSSLSLNRRELQTDPKVLWTPNLWL
jgi:hypothetical protein